MMTRVFLPLLASSALLLAGCMENRNPDGSLNPNANRNQAAVAGAVIGGIIGNTVGGDDDRFAKTALGAAVGGMIGGAIGANLDRQAMELEQSLTTDGVRIVNTGDRLIVTMPQDVLFDIDSASVRPALRADLNTLAASLNRYPDTHLQVIGHTDNTGDAGYNQRLSEDRADSVAYVLISAGVASSRITSVGRGEDYPVASNLTAEGRAQNRRVEFVIIPNQ